MPQTSYDVPIATVGQVGTWDSDPKNSLLWPLLAQTTDLAVGTSTAGLHTVRIYDATAKANIDTSFTVVAETVAQLTDAMAQAMSDNYDLKNILTATSDGVSAIALVFLHNGYDYEVSFPANPGTDFTISSQTAAGGVRMPLGLGVVRTGDREARFPATGDVALDIEGIVVRNANELLAFAINQPAPGIDPSKELSVLISGTCWVLPEVAVAVSDPVFVRVTAGAGEQAGAIRNDADGGDAVQIPGRFETSAAAGGLARMRINTP